MSAIAAAELCERVLAGDLRALARAATLIEAETPAGRELITHLFASTGRAQVIGITGPSGAGKSTLVDALAKLLRREGKTVGIIAVDPSSPYSRGAILGDRIRMGDHHNDSGVFIRSMATRGKLGGVARATLELALLLDAAGRDVVLIETVGVGQDETDIARLAAVTVVVLVPGLGDDVQAIKAGIMEIADVFVINKADHPGAGRLEQEIRATQSLADHEERAKAAPVMRTIATQEQGIEELLGAIRQELEERERGGFEQTVWSNRLKELLRDKLLAAIPQELLEQQATLVAERRQDPYGALDAILARIFEVSGEEQWR